MYKTYKYWRYHVQKQTSVFLNLPSDQNPISDSFFKICLSRSLISNQWAVSWNIFHEQAKVWDQIRAGCIDWDKALGEKIVV